MSYAKMSMQTAIKKNPIPLLIVTWMLLLVLLAWLSIHLIEQLSLFDIVALLDFALRFVGLL